MSEELLLGGGSQALWKVGFPEKQLGETISELQWDYFSLVSLYLVGCGALCSMDTNCAGPQSPVPLLCRGAAFLCSLIQLL